MGRANQNHHRQVDAEVVDALRVEQGVGELLGQPDALDEAAVPSLTQALRMSCCSSSATSGATVSGIEGILRSATKGDPRSAIGGDSGA
jgi:hypothetical protein